MVGALVGWRGCCFCRSRDDLAMGRYDAKKELDLVWALNMTKWRPKILLEKCFVRCDLLGRAGSSKKYALDNA